MSSHLSSESLPLSPVTRGCSNCAHDVPANIPKCWDCADESAWEPKPNAGTLSPVAAAYNQTECEAVLPLDAWAESDGDALWWRFPVSEPPYVGSPLYDDFPGYVTHWTRIRVPTEPESSQPKKTAPVVEERYLDGLLHCLGCAHDHTSDDPRCNDCVCGSLFEASKPALTDIEQIALEMLGDFTRWSNTGECSYDLIKLAERLRTALTKRGAF